MTILPKIPRVVPVDLGDVPTTYPDSFFRQIRLDSTLVENPGPGQSVLIRVMVDDHPYNYEANKLMPGDARNRVVLTEDFLAFASQYPFVQQVQKGFMGVLIAMNQRHQLEQLIAVTEDGEAKAALEQHLAVIEQFLATGELPVME